MARIFLQYEDLITWIQLEMVDGTPNNNNNTFLVMYKALR